MPSLCDVLKAVFNSMNSSLIFSGWNRLFFLWGVFRERRPNCPETRSVAGSKPAIPDLDLERPPQELPSQPVADIPALKREPMGISAEDPSVSAEAVAMAGAERRKPSHVDDEPPAQRTPGRGAADCVLLQPDENPSRATAATDSSASKIGEIGLRGTSPSSRIKDGGAQPLLETKSRNGPSQVVF